MVFKLADTQKKKSASCVPGTVLSILYTLIKSILITTSSSSYFHVINEENEDKLSKVTYLQVAEVGLTQTHPAPVWVLAAGTKSPGWKSMTLPWTSLPVRLAPSRLMPICLHRPLALCVSEGVRHCAGRRGGDSQASMGSPPQPPRSCSHSPLGRFLASLGLFAAPPHAAAPQATCGSPGRASLCCTLHTLTLSPLALLVLLTRVTAPPGRAFPLSTLL